MWMSNQPLPSFFFFFGHFFFFFFFFFLSCFPVSFSTRYTMCNHRENHHFFLLLSVLCMCARSRSSLFLESRMPRAAPSS